MLAIANTISLVIRTPLHCAASCNNVHLCKLLVESGAAIFATTISDVETAADKCEEMEEGYIQCSQFLYGNIKKNIWVVIFTIKCVSRVVALHDFLKPVLYFPSRCTGEAWRNE